MVLLMKKTKLISVILIFSLIFASLAISGCTNEETEEQLNPKAKINVQNAELRATDSMDTTPSEGNVYLYLKVEIESLNEKEDLSINPYSFELVTDNQTTYTASLWTTDNMPDSITPQSSETFWIGFEIPEKREGETLRFEPSWFQEDPFTASIPSYDTTPPKIASLDILDAEERNEDSMGFTPDEGNIYLYVNVKIENLKDEGDLSLTGATFKVETDTGSKFNSWEKAGDPDSITSGNSTTLWVGFEIPESQTGNTLHYEPIWGNDLQLAIPSY